MAKMIFVIFVLLSGQVRSAFADVQISRNSVS
jgi:hypothetical protein